MFDRLLESDRGGGAGSRHKERGFAAMDPREQREIARKGGEAVSRDREHMAAIGRKGGAASSNARSANGGGGGNQGDNQDGGSRG